MSSNNNSYLFISAVTDAYCDAMEGWHLLKVFHVTALKAKNSLTSWNIFYFRPKCCQWPTAGWSHYWQRIWVQLAPGSRVTSGPGWLLESSGSARFGGILPLSESQSRPGQPGPGNSGSNVQDINSLPMTGHEWEHMCHVFSVLDIKLGPDSAPMCDRRILYYWHVRAESIAA